MSETPFFLLRKNGVFFTKRYILDTTKEVMPIFIVVRQVIIV